MKNKKGITLIALVITIIVLIILAGISINLLMGDNGILTRAKEAKTLQEKTDLIEQMQLDIIAKQFENNGTLTQADLEGVLGTYGTVENGSVTTTKGGYVIPITDVYNGTITPAHTYTAYTMGDVVTLGGEDFYVIENSNSNTATVKLIAKLNVITTEGDTNRYKQDADANPLAFDDDRGDYTSSEIKKHVNNYKAAVEGRMGLGKTIQEARLMTGTAEGTWNEDYTVWTYTSGTGEIGALLNENKIDIVYGTTPKLEYWIGTGYTGLPVHGAWFVSRKHHASVGYSCFR